MAVQLWPRLIEVGGTPYEVGYQFGTATAADRGKIAASIDAMCRRIGESDAFQEAALAAARAGLEEHSPATIAYIAGMADALALDADQMLRSVFGTYLDDLAGAPHKYTEDGCSTWAAGSDATADGTAILVKNRDYRPYHLDLQAMLRVAPKRGIPWIALTSAGAPGIYCAGMNAAGLAVADSYVSSSDVGPGIPRFSLMMHVLEQVETVQQAFQYLDGVPNMGNGNLIFADAAGDTGVYECGYRLHGHRRQGAGVIVSTNHFLTIGMPERERHAPDSFQRQNSCARNAYLASTLGGMAGSIDDEAAGNIMAHHDDPIGAICRHSIPGSDAATIACVISRPATRQFSACFGFPCLAPFRTEPVVAP